VAQTDGHTYIKQHQLSGDAMLLDLAEASSDVLEEARASGAGRAARTLVKDGPLRMTIVGISASGSLHEHKAGGPVSIQALTGTARVNVGDRSVDLGERQTLVLGRDITHSVTAAGEAVILLTIGMPG
jgi:quercetin dioxygenase-like cupin family protein